MQKLNVEVKSQRKRKKSKHELKQISNEKMLNRKLCNECAGGSPVWLSSYLHLISTHTWVLLVLRKFPFKMSWLFALCLLLLLVATKKECTTNQHLWQQWCRCRTKQESNDVQIIEMSMQSALYVVKYALSKQ